MGKGRIHAALIIKVRPGQVARHLNRGHAVDAVVGRQQRGQSLDTARQRRVEARYGGDVGGLDFLDPVDGKTVGPDDMRVHGPGVFQRDVLYVYGIGSNAVAGRSEGTVSQDHGRGSIAVESAVPSADPVLVADLVIQFDVELVIRSQRYAVEAEVVELPRSRHIRLRVKIDDALPDGINFGRRNDV